jgi:hypothetical protein
MWNVHPCAHRQDAQALPIFVDVRSVYQPTVKTHLGGSGLVDVATRRHVIRNVREHELKLVQLDVVPKSRQSSAALFLMGATFGKRAPAHVCLGSRGGAASLRPGGCMTNPRPSSCVQLAEQGERHGGAAGRSQVRARGLRVHGQTRQQILQRLLPTSWSHDGTALQLSARRV